MMTSDLFAYLNNEETAEPLPADEAEAYAKYLGEATRQDINPLSLAVAERTLFFLGKSGGRKRLGVISAQETLFAEFSGETSDLSLGDRRLHMKLCETTAANAGLLRSTFSFLNPQILGLKKSAGCGDRLGLATPGHIRAIRHSSLAPIFAQQSIRENARTGRTPQEVMDDALWGIFQEGWRGGFGADADHLKTTEDIDSCVDAGFTFYTIDPGEHVDNEANTAPVDFLKTKIAALPWEALESSWAETKSRLGQTFDLGDFKLAIGDEELLRAAAKYGRVVAHTARMYRHLEQAMNGKPFELEMSVDETETVTNLAEHVYLAHELKRLGVRWVSLAPRYVGTFEKGVDYLGDLAEFEQSFAQHLAVSHTFGPYKLSLHSGSDKFSIYPIAARVAGELVHLKTAGTSYLEALRAIGQVNPGLFREIAGFARERYAIDRASYHVSAEVDRMPDPAKLSDDRLTELLDDFHAREILHVTFGSVLHHPEFRGPFFSELRTNEEVYYRMLESHFDRHFAPFREVAAISG
ncbi:MAG: hypothetical protein J2P41_12505 [Blastocatellia bacterium]|nr:hypothetical protein [Blastocatellia bacterium]